MFVWRATALCLQSAHQMSVSMRVSAWHATKDAACALYEEYAPKILRCVVGAIRVEVGGPQIYCFCMALRRCSTHVSCWHTCPETYRWLTCAEDVWRPPNLYFNCLIHDTLKHANLTWAHLTHKVPLAYTRPTKDLRGPPNLDFILLPSGTLSQQHACPMRL